MTNQQILTKAIKKALDNGWKPAYLLPAPHNQNIVEPQLIPFIIFNHDFAKALWGEQTDTMTVQNNSINVRQIIDMNGWRYHLQQMVVAKDRIKYLGEHLDA